MVRLIDKNGVPYIEFLPFRVETRAGEISAQSAFSKADFCVHGPYGGSFRICPTSYASRGIIEVLDRGYLVIPVANLDQGRCWGERIALPTEIQKDLPRVKKDLEKYAK